VGEDVEKQRLSLLDYLRQQNWTARPAAHGPEFVGLCPLQPETRPSFYVNTRKNLFYAAITDQQARELNAILDGTVSGAAKKWSTLAAECGQV
jgi:hypothetical protein